MLQIIQRLFYCELGSKPQAIVGWDLDAREHLALWPVVLLFLAMGLFSPLWMRAIDGFGAPTTNRLASAQNTSSADPTALQSTAGGAQ
jgi:NADH-quinone oxidoreductase subunit M